MEFARIIAVVALFVSFASAQPLPGCEFGTIMADPNYPNQIVVAPGGDIGNCGPYADQSCYPVFNGLPTLKLPTTCTNVTLNADWTCPDNIPKNCYLKFGTPCQFKCTDGYSKAGRTRYCLESGVLSGENQVCVHYSYKTETAALVIVLVAVVVGFFYTVWLGMWTLKQGVGTEAMQSVSAVITEGANAFVKTQYTTIAKLSLPVALFIFLIYGLVRSSGDLPAGEWRIAAWMGSIFLVGALFSTICGIAGMFISVKTNVRACAAAVVSSELCLTTCFRGGAFNGMLICCMSLGGVSALYAICRVGFNFDPIDVPLMLVGFGFGASYVALFAQLGGGIYTKAADVGADLVGKVEKDLPEDDPRNPATVADLVGDNVGDCAGRGADLFESTCAENIGAMILGSTVVRYCAADQINETGFILFPLVLQSIGMFASMVGILCVYQKKVDAPAKPVETVQLTDAGHQRNASASQADNGHSTQKSSLQWIENEENPLNSLYRAYAITLVIAASLMIIAARFMLYSELHDLAWAHYMGCAFLGIILSFIFVAVTDYYTGTQRYPVDKIAMSAAQGHGVVVIQGLGFGLESTGVPALCIAVGLVAAYWLGRSSGLGENSPLGQDLSADVAGIYGTAVETMGMLMTVGFILAMDTFGPISDNAGGIAEMSHSGDEVRARCDRLDAVGNTTKALTKGYAVGSAGLATFLLFRAYLDELSNYADDASLRVVDFSIPEVFVSGLLGVALVFFFSSLALRAVGNAAQCVIDEVRRQLREKPGIMTGAVKADYAQCVSIVTHHALREMVLPGLLVVLSPIILGLIMRGIGQASSRDSLGGTCLACFLMCATIGGLLMGLFLNNAGGAWDNAKKTVASDPRFPGKHSEDHKAAVTGDTVGDPCKDTAGPSLHVLVKLVSTVVLVLYPLFLKGADT